jgi:hypothetical protein
MSRRWNCTVAGLQLFGATLRLRDLFSLPYGNWFASKFPAAPDRISPVNESSGREFGIIVLCSVQVPEQCEGEGDSPVFSAIFADNRWLRTANWR